VPTRSKKEDLMTNYYPQKNLYLYNLDDSLIAFKKYDETEIQEEHSDIVGVVKKHCIESPVELP